MKDAWIVDVLAEMITLVGSNRKLSQLVEEAYEVARISLAQSKNDTLLEIDRLNGKLHQNEPQESSKADNIIAFKGAADRAKTRLILTD